MTETTLTGTNQVSRAFREIPSDRALGYLERYFGLAEYEGNAYTGAHFERFSTTPADEITAEDLVAVSCLSVHVPARAALVLLGERREEVSNLLSQIPADLTLAELALEDFCRYFTAGGPALALWRLLRSKEKPWGVGPTTASKVLARKRPALIPIYDSVVAKATGFRNDSGTWKTWHQAFTGQDSLVQELESLRNEAGLDDISLLRILDVVLWMNGARGQEPRETVGDEN
jgi:hypothetical protein